MNVWRSLSVVLGMLVGATCNLCGQKFLIPVIPDTQNEVATNSAMYFKQMEWIVEQSNVQTIPLVLHIGDVVNWDIPKEWEIASQGFDKLDKKMIPYSITLGNHDTDVYGPTMKTDTNRNLDVLVRNTQRFNSYFPTHRFKNQRGRFEEGKSDNAYYTFRAENTNWLVVTLEFCPRQAAIHWASDIIGAHPDHNTIVLTHYYLTPKGIIGDQVGRYGDSSPQVIFNRLIKKHANIHLVLSGHVMSSAYKEDVGEKGNKIVQLLQDYQGEDFGGGYLRLLEIDVEKGTIDARMYSPYYDKNRTDNSNYQFEGFKFLR